MAPSSASSSALVAELLEHAGAWPHVSLAPHPPRAVALHLDEAVIGVLHHDGLLEIPVPTPIRTVLVDEGFAAPQTARPGAEWVTTHLRAPDDLAAAALLLRLSYLYRRLLRSRDPVVLQRIRTEVAHHPLPRSLATIYEAMLDKRGTDVSLSGTDE